MDDQATLDRELVRAVRAVADAVPAARPDVAHVRWRARRRRQRVTAVAAVAAVAAVGLAVAGLGAFTADRMPVRVTAPAGEPVVDRPDLTVVDGVRVVEVAADGAAIERWRAPDGWYLHAGPPVPLPGDRIAVLTATDDPGAAGGFRVALQVVGSDGAVQAAHPVPTLGDHLALLDATDVEATLLRQPNGVAGDSRVVVHDLRTGVERPRADGLDQDGATASGGGVVVHVRPWTCALEVTDEQGTRTLAGGCADGWTASVATPAVSPDGRLAAVAWELRTGTGPVVEGPLAPGAVAVTVVDLQGGTVEWSTAALDPAELAVRRITWIDPTRLRLAAEGPAADDLPVPGDDLAVEVVPPTP